MREKIKLSGVPETMLQTIYARAKESRGRGIIHDAKAEEIIEKLRHLTTGRSLWLFHGRSLSDPYAGIGRNAHRPSHH